MTAAKLKSDLRAMRLALALARRGYGTTSPNPMVGAVLVKGGNVIGRGWHRRAGEAHAEIEALRDAQKRGHSPRGATLYVTLEPCCTHGRTPPCTEAIQAAGIKRVVVGAVDPNPKHSGKGFAILKRAGIEVKQIGQTHPRPLQRRGAFDRTRPPSSPPGRGQEWVHVNNSAVRIADQCARLNEEFNHWIVLRTPFVTVKAAMTLDGKIATASGESKWITGEQARAHGMKLRQGSDAILVGINTILADNPSLTVRAGAPSTASARFVGVQASACPTDTPKRELQRAEAVLGAPELRRIVLDSLARTPLDAKVVSDEHAALTTIVVGKRAPKSRVAALAKRVKVLVAPSADSKFKIQNSKLDLGWLLKKLGSESVTSLLVEGGGEVNASFLLQGLAHRVAFFYAPKILGGRDARRAVAGAGIGRLADVIQLSDVEWRRLGPDLLLTARLEFKL